MKVMKISSKSNSKQNYRILSEIGIDSKEILFKEHKNIFEPDLQSAKRNKTFSLKETGKIVSHLDSVRGLWKD